MMVRPGPTPFFWTNGMKSLIPDAKEADDGFIYVTYDHERVTEREILMARFTEEDIIKGKTVTCGSNFKIVVNKATGQPNIH